MRIKITNEASSRAGFISWKRLATELFKNGCELSVKEHVTHLEIGENGINYFVATSTPSNGERQ
jgi:hypothetical protein